MTYMDEVLENHEITELIEHEMGMMTTHEERIRYLEDLKEHLDELLFEESAALEEE